MAKLTSSNFFQQFLSALRHLFSEILFRLKTSPESPLYWIANRISDHFVDRQLGISSSQSRPIEQTELKLLNCSPYQPTPYSDLRKLLNAISVAHKDAFLDVGSGMGRTLCVTAEYPFHSVLGVEISPELCKIAKRTIDRVRANLQCADVQTIAANAVDYPVPLDVSVVYFFNLFGPCITAKVLNNLANSLQEEPRTMTVIFYGTASSQDFQGEANRCDWMILSSKITLPTGAVGLIYTNNQWTGPGGLKVSAKVMPELSGVRV